MNGAILKTVSITLKLLSASMHSTYVPCGTKSGQILLNCVTDAIIVNIYIKYRLKLIENELGHTFELNVTF